MTQRALVTGATGLLGRQVVKTFETAGWEVTGTGFSRASPPKILKVDIQDEDEIVKVLDEVKPHIVIHCAANRQPDSCTADPDSARRLNVTATRTLARQTAKRFIFLLYISTDYIFPGRPGQAPYASDAPPNPPNVYGQTKLDGETAVLRCTQSGGLGVVLRVPVLYGHIQPEGNNQESAINVLMDALWKSQDLKPEQPKTKMDDWALRYPTNTEDVARICLDIIKLYMSATHTADGERLPPILQFSSEDKYTKFEICQVFAEIMGLSMDGMVADKDGGKPGPDGTMRPYDCHLSTQDLKDLGFNVQTMDFVGWWRREVRAFRH